MPSTFVNAITVVLAQVWRFFSLPFPLVGLTCGQVLIGCFVVTFSIHIIGSLLSLAGIISGSIASGVRSAHRNSYASYAHGKKRAEKYEARYSHAKKNKVDIWGD